MEVLHNLQSSDEFYPPQFEVFFVSYKENATLSDGKVSFKGATTDIEFDTHLDTHVPITPPEGKTTLLSYLQAYIFILYTSIFHQCSN